MSMNIRTADGIALSPDRDIRYLYPQLIKLVVARFNANVWPELNAILESNGGTWDGLCNANDAVATFLSTSCDKPEQSLKEVLEASGWFKTTPVEQAVYCSMLGQVLLCQLFYALRDTTHLGEKPDGIGEIVRLSKELKVSDEPAGNAV